QETLFRHNLTKVLNLVQLSLYGRVDEDITFDFVPLRELNEKDLAEIRNQNAQSDNIYSNLNAVASDEIRKKLADDSTSGWNNLDLSRKVEAVSTPAPNPTGSQPNEVGA
ncbi:MAG TPA: anti-CBASS Acb1 family protein, partial [Anaerolineae bacterium]|nr:anti-CBASS Acb1 family protein [Anaerolineae bacterium]